MIVFQTIIVTVFTAIMTRSIKLAAVGHILKEVRATGTIY